MIPALIERKYYAAGVYGYSAVSEPCRPGGRISFAAGSAARGKSRKRRNYAEGNQYPWRSGFVPAATEADLVPAVAVVLET